MAMVKKVRIHAYKTRGHFRFIKQRPIIGTYTIAPVVHSGFHGCMFKETVYAMNFFMRIISSKLTTKTQWILCTDNWNIRVNIMFDNTVSSSSHPDSYRGCVGVRNFGLWRGSIFWIVYFLFKMFVVESVRYSLPRKMHDLWIHAFANHIMCLCIKIHML